MSDQVSKPQTDNIVDPSSWFKDYVTATDRLRRNEAIYKFFRESHAEVRYISRELIQPPSDKFLDTERETRLKTEAAQRLGHASIIETNLTDKALGSEALKYIRDRLLQNFVRTVGTKIQELYGIFEGAIEDLDKLEDNESNEVVDKRRQAARKCKEHIEALVWEVKEYKKGRYFPAWIFEPGIQNVAHEIGYKRSDNPDLVDSIGQALQASKAAEHAVSKLVWLSSILESLVKP